ncbi:MAG: DMT family transporter [Pseudomonadota bacterium]
MNSSLSDRPRQYLLGISLIIAAALTISIQDLVFKLFSGDLTLWQIFTLRGLFALPMLLVIGWMRGSRSRTLLNAFDTWILLRSVFITTTFLAFYAAIPFLSLSTVGAANYIAPIFVALLSAYVIQEPVGFLGWLAVGVGFLGVILLLQPGTEAFSAWTLLPLIGAGFYALAHITTRVKCQDAPLAALSLAQNLMMFLSGAVISIVLYLAKPEGGTFDDYPYLFDTWTHVETRDWLVIFVLAGFAVVLGMMLAGAYQAAPPAVISTFEYSYLVFVVAWDIIFFDTIPTALSVAGMIFIVTAGLLVLKRH